MRHLLFACAVLLAAGSARAATEVTTTTTRKVMHHHAAVVTTHAATVVRDAHGRVVKRVAVTTVRRVHPAGHRAMAAAVVHSAVHARHAAHAVAGRVAPHPAVQEVAAPPPPPVVKPMPAVDPNKGTATGLPLPRYAALRSDQVSFRAGPGTRYPIQWIYQRRDLPVKIEREFEVWRLVSVPDGFRGWVHLAMLTGRRGFLVSGDQPATLRATANEAGEPEAILKPGVVGRLTGCPATSAWCSVEVKTYRGYVGRDAIAGLLPGEAIVP